MSTLLKPFQVRNMLMDKNLQIFTLQEFLWVTNTSVEKAKYFLEKQTTEEFFIRLKRGLYTLVTDQPSEKKIANALYKPSYISFEYALAYWNILPEMPHTVTSATTIPTRKFTNSTGNYFYYSIKKEAYTGYQLVNKDYESFLIAEKEKALVDYLYFQSLGKKSENDRLDLTGLDKKLILSYSKLYNRKGLIKLIEKLTL
jgi:predicted transcriptional regulator of viral defense system